MSQKIKSSSAPKLKTYVLLAHTNPTANVFQRISKTQRVRIGRRKLDAAFLKVQYTDKFGMNKIIRFKSSCNEIDQAVQIKEYGIPANEKFTDREMEIRYFRDGVLQTNNVTFQKFLEASPQFDGFWVPDEEGRVGSCDSISQPLYTIYDPEVIIKSENQAFKNRLAAGNKINALELQEAQDQIIRLMGVQTKPPASLEECQNILVNYLDEADEEGIAAFMREELNVDEAINLLITKAENAGKLAFEAKQDQVVLVKNGKEVDVKQISSSLPAAERRRLFAEFLVSDAGNLLKIELQDLMAEKKSVKETVK